MTDIRLTNTLRLLQSAEEIRARISGEFSAVHGLSVNEFFLLLHLEQTPKHRLSRVELAKRMHINASTVTRMALPMEKLGLVTRQADARDARLAFVVITDTGLQKLAETRETLKKQAGYIFDERWDGAELDQLSSLLNRLQSTAIGMLA